MRPRLLPPVVRRSQSHQHMIFLNLARQLEEDFPCQLHAIVFML